jgi:hypothetical protein
MGLVRSCGGAELTRGDPQEAFEMAMQVALVYKARLKGRAGDRHPLPQFRQSMKNSSLDEVLARGQAHCSAKAAHQVIGAQTGYSSEVGERDVLSETSV